MPRTEAVEPVVSPEWLQRNLDNPGIQVIENAWIPASYSRAHIPGALAVPCHPHLKHFDTAGVKTCQVMTADEFTTLCHDLGLRRDRHCVVYDDYHGLFAARLRAVCQHYGYTRVSILDGGWHGWLERGFPVSARPVDPTPGSDVDARRDSALMIGLVELRSLLQDDGVQLWDTRRPAEFAGTEETDNLRRGHLPGALNLSWTELLTGDETEGTARFIKPLPELANQLADLGLRQDRTVITYCQSGIRAAFCLLVLELLGYRDRRLYDASMSEWCNRPDTPLISPAT